jgi:hypothetical protein
MDAGVEVADGLMHRAVAGDAAHLGQCGGADQHMEMAFARAVIAGMAVVPLAVVADVECGGLEGRDQPFLQFLFNAHKSPLQSPARMPRMSAPSRKGKRMTKPPFEFDIRVSTDKKRKKVTRRGMSGAFDTSTKACEFPNCKEQGLYRAPKSPDLLDDFFWFCKEHIREYNLKWNFFQGTTDEEFQKFLEKDRVWERETKPFSRKDDGNAWARVGVKDPMEILGEKATRNPGAAPVTTATRKLPPTERKALEVLDARDTWTKTEIRKQYKSLVKDLHPDMNGGNRDDEGRLQEVVWAWDQIKDSRYFRD